MSSEAITKNDLAGILNEIAVSPAGNLVGEDANGDISITRNITAGGDIEATGDVTDGAGTSIAELKDMLTVKTWSPSITTTTGTLVSVSGRKQGNVYQLQIGFRKTTSTASGSNFFAGTLNNFAPTIAATAGGYVAAVPIGALITASGSITIRNASPSAYTFASTTTAYVTFTYIVE